MKNAMPTWGPTGQEVYERTYSRIKNDGEQETWGETVARVVDGNIALNPKGLLEGEVGELFDLIYTFKAIPAGRHLWTSGVEGRTFNRNCHRAGWGPRLSDHFTFLFDELMKGGGVGSNYSADYLEALPAIVGRVLPVFILDETHPDSAELSGMDELVMGQSSEATTDAFVVQDSREGWVDAMRHLIELSTESGLHAVTFDLSEVRSRGSVLKGFGGTASGPGPLAAALDMTATTLGRAVGGQLLGLDAMEIDHSIAQCVVAGNIRRSARMSILHWNDPAIFDFISLKADTGSHWTTNLSVEIDDAFFVGLTQGMPQAVEVFGRVTEAMMENGEPGFFNSSLASEGERGDVRCTNPCGEIALEDWESCNLGHVNLAAFGTDYVGASRAFRLMSRFLIRATHAELLDPRQSEVEGRNRRIGVGLFGFQEFLGAHGVKFSEASESSEVRAALVAFRGTVDAESKSYAAELGIPVPLKSTTVAPTGSIAKLPGVSEGVHPVYARYYERRIRYAANDPKLEALAKDHEIEDCIYSPDTRVVVFVTRDSICDAIPEHLIEQADEISVGDLLATQRMVQECYANNAVSFTANVDPELSIGELRAALGEHLPHLKGTTMMPDASRPQSPYTRISREEYEAASLQEIGQAMDDCVTGACPVR